ncbi:hypothetical protein CDAR_114591 [Caerostris darwini]|uniref:Uncharacterized protein n=1 Tax=Caerostris darwini TaxID=1538125 RepID=A0AAV4R0A0_9ARAC|nr:hypothetical protein CDAR_114591 [Caerostris darwini]
MADIGVTDDPTYLTLTGTRDALRASSRSLNEYYEPEIEETIHKRDRSLRNWVVCRINSKSRRYRKHTVRQKRSCRPIKDVWTGRKKFRPEIARTGKLPDLQPLKALTNLLTCSEAPGRD